MAAGTDLPLASGKPDTIRRGWSLLGTGCSRFLLSSGFEWGRYYSVAEGCFLTRPAFLAGRRWHFGPELVDGQWIVGRWLETGARRAGGRGCARKDPSHFLSSVGCL